MLSLFIINNYIRKPTNLVPVELHKNYFFFIIEDRISAIQLVIFNIIKKNQTNLQQLTIIYISFPE
jgi:hypothetical protein